MPFKRFVEIGRVALINYGKEYGRLVVIVDVIDQTRALVDAPDMVRTQINLKRLSLTDIKIDIKRIPKKKDLIKAMEDADVKNKWEKSSWGRKLIVKKRRASLNDFDRFKLMLAKIKVLLSLLFYFSIRAVHIVKLKCGFWILICVCACLCCIDGNIWVLNFMQRAAVVRQELAKLKKSA
ncbi:hypothetical protein Fmac_024204 [Flemingia macrophylla]|uniref:Large ribosomal subunit protein eL14 domain-containing protein n=1 Tax=Flemingia macrophylla TaxID=520843 RepID=A0ABD1LNU4_9FABA